MKPQRRVVEPNQLPIRMPLCGTAVVYLLLEDLGLMGTWVAGAAGLLVLLVWVAWVLDVIHRRPSEVAWRDETHWRHR